MTNEVAKSKGEPTLLAIIADDLTGALDAAAPLAMAGARVMVATRPETLSQALGSGADVVAVSTRSREVAPDAAVAAVAGVLAALPARVRLFKKIDSRLKGNIAAELSAFGDVRFLVLPAIPDFGRIVRDGAVTGFGVPLPIPVTEALGPVAVRAAFPDTRSQADLATSLAGAEPKTVLVGARGLAQALAAARSTGAPAVLPDLVAPLLFAVGSVDPITSEQVERLRAARPDLASVDAPSGRLAAPVRLAPLMLIRVVAGPAEPPASVARNFARAVAPVADSAGTVLVTGGATAEAVFDAMGLGCLEVVGEILPGLPLCRSGDKFLITKSGGFGGANTFLRLAAAVATPADVRRTDRKA